MKNPWIVPAATAVAAAAVVAGTLLVFLPRDKAAQSGNRDVVSNRQPADQGAAGSNRRTDSVSTADPASESLTPDVPDEPLRSAEEQDGMPEPVPPVTERLSQREQAAASWEKLVDELASSPSGELKDRAARVKQAFENLDREDRMEGIQAALNLIPDEQFPALEGILLDRTEPPEILDALFSDAMNRPEEIKLPILHRIRQDRQHPLFAESARILDVLLSGKEPTDSQMEE